MKKTEYIEKLEDGTKLKFIVYITSSMWEDYKINIHVSCFKCLPKKRTWILNDNVTDENKKHYQRLYLTEMINNL